MGAWLWLRLEHLSSGNGWYGQLATDTRTNLRWFFYDGVLSASSDAIKLNYLTLFVLALGASGAEIGWMNSFASLSAMLMLLPGAMLVGRVGRRKPVVVLGGGVFARAGLLLLALIPFFFVGPAAIYVAIAIKVIMDGFGNLAFPGWTSLTGDIVPLEWRGRYFGWRNLVMGGAGMLITFLGGQLITAVGAPAGYQFAFGLSFVIGMAATFCYARIAEPEQARPFHRMREYLPSALLSTLRADPNFLVYCLQAMLFNVSLYVAVPFFSVHLVKNLGATAAVVGTLGIVSSMAGLPSQRLFGWLTDRWGPHRVMLVTGFLVPLLPLSWLLVRNPWHVIPINIAGGIWWAGYSLASLNNLLDMAPSEQRALYSAMFQISVSLAIAIGSALGGVIVLHWGFPAVFAISGVGRLVAAGVFARYVRQPVRK